MKVGEEMDGLDGQDIGQVKKIGMEIYLNKYLYLSGKVNMKEIEITTQHLNQRWI